MARGGRRTSKEVSHPLSEDETGEVTRCICGIKKNRGFMIQCQKCMVWQHGDCVDVTEHNIPEVYECELCQPSPHPDSIHVSKRSEFSRQSTQTKRSRNATDLCSSASRKYRAHTPKDYISSKEKSLANGPIKIRLNLPEKEEDNSCSSGIGKADKQSPQHFTTRRGRKTTRITYSTYSEEEFEFQKDLNVSASSFSPVVSTSPKVIKPADEILSELPKKKKRKENRSKKLFSESSRANHFDLPLTPSPTYEAQYPPMLAYKKMVFPKLPHEDPEEYCFQVEKSFRPPTISISKYSPPALLDMPLSPPPKPKSISSRMSFKDMNKRVNAMHNLIEIHQSQLKEHIKSVPENYKAQKQHYSSSSKMAKELLHNIHSFYEKYGTL